jgi:FlaA1/EpsC-like NDP-sugar epimerase
LPLASARSSSRADSHTETPEQDKLLTLKPIRNRHLFVADFVSVVAATLLAFLVRFEEPHWIIENFRLVGIYLALSVPVRLFIFFLAGMYRRLWRHASVGELRPILVAAIGGGAACAAIGLVLMPVTSLTPSRVPFPVVFIDTFLTATLIALPRLIARVGRRGYLRRRRDDAGKRVLIAGAGDAGKLVAKELFASSRLGLHPIGFVDSDATKHGHMLAGLPVFGPLAHIPEIVERFAIAEIIIAMPSASGTVIRQVVRAALSCGIPTRTVPSLPEIISRQGNATGLREVEIQDLLRRDAVETDLAAVAELATSETVLITGAGGSIGAELCRQVARLAPSRLVILGHGENSIFDILQELTLSSPQVEIVPVIADIRDRNRINRVFHQYRPHAVFHAAAHKHVPLMEDNVLEAITNNVAGTRNVVDAAIETSVQHFVLISTDKAVRPTSVMGATKRVAEQIVQHAATKYQRNFVSVRFGNVLGSRGSVVPTFLRQIRAGGPVTVTHPEMRRYFMTIPEAVQLVLQAGALGNGGEVFVLDMGEPIRVVDIATDLIRLSGLEVGADIEIRYTGVRPGEKLYEEMFFTAEHVLPTDHPKVLRARNGLLADETIKRIDNLIRSTDQGRGEDEIRKLLQTLVPDFHPHGATTSSEEIALHGVESARRA